MVPDGNGTTLPLTLTKAHCWPVSLTTVEISIHRLLLILAWNRHMHQELFCIYRGIVLNHAISHAPIIPIAYLLNGLFVLDPKLWKTRQTGHPLQTASLP